DRRRVGVDEHGRDPFFAERLARLRAGVVELRRLADHDRARPEDEHLARLLGLHRAADRLQYRPTLADHFYDPVVQVLVVLRTGTALGVVLDAERGQRAMTEAFDRAVVEVALRDEEVARGKRGGIDLELVVLAGDVNPSGLEVLDRVIGAVVAVGKA